MEPANLWLTAADNSVSYSEGCLKHSIALFACSMLASIIINPLGSFVSKNKYSEFIALDKKGTQISIFISPRKHIFGYLLELV